jgi:cysteine desulfurase
VLASAVEHHAVLDSLDWLGEQASTYACSTSTTPDGCGRICSRPARRRPRSVALLSCMWANNEVGTIQPLDEVVAPRARRRRPGAHATPYRRSARLPVDFAAAGWTR